MCAQAQRILGTRHHCPARDVRPFGRPRLSTPPAPPQGRYGRTPSRARRMRLRWAAVALALLASVAIAYVAYRNLGTAPIESQRVAFTQKPGNAMEVTLDVRRDDPASPAVCVVRVRDISGAETGRREVLVTPGEGRITTLVQSTQAPVTADVVGCTYNVPQYLSRP